MSSPAIDLSQFDAEYRRQLNNPDNQFGEIPDGRYHVLVENVELTNSRTSGLPMMKWRLRVIGPTHANRLLWKNSAITDKSMPFVTQDLSVCQLQLDRFADLEHRLTDLIDLHLEVQKYTGQNGRDNITILNLADADLRP